MAGPVRTETDPLNRGEGGPPGDGAAPDATAPGAASRAPTEQEGNGDLSPQDLLSAPARLSDPAIAALHRAMEESPWSFDFFQAVRRLECSRHDLPRVGRSEHVHADPVRFGQVPSLAFAPSTLARFDRSGDIPRLLVHFLGLLGPNGPLPLFMSEYVRDRQLNQDDPTLAAFFDVFHHRVLSLFYRAWACNQPTVSYDRPEDDRFGVYIGSLIGIGLPSLLDRDSVPDGAKLHYSGRLSPHAKNAEGLMALLQDYFGVKTDIQQFVGQWLDLPPQSGCRMGRSRESGLLGQTIVVGSRVYDCQMKFRLRMGPMTFAEYRRLLPGGNSLKRLVDWVRNYVGDELGWDVQLILKASEIPKTRLGQLGQLGWTTWIHSKPMTEDADDLILQPSAA